MLVLLTSHVKPALNRLGMGRVLFFLFSAVKEGCLL